MTRANRIFVPNVVWHLTHRCHKREFLLKFQRDRLRWRFWLFRAVRRFDLCVLNYVVTSNHIHLLVADDGEGRIAKAMQLVASRTAQEFNLRKGRKGAFWEDRYHATAVESNHHFVRCLTYIDLNMVRAGAVTHPSQWATGGFNEIQSPRQRYQIINLERLTHLCGFDDFDTLRNTHRHWVESQLRNPTHGRQPEWSEAIAVGSESFVKNIQGKLGVIYRQRQVSRIDTHYQLRDECAAYDAFLGSK